jgi:hypothetical protein
MRSSIRRGPGQGEGTLPLDADPAAVRRRWATVWAILGLPGLPAAPRGSVPAVSGAPPSSRTRDGPLTEAETGGGSPPRPPRRPRPITDRPRSQPRGRRVREDAPAARETHEVA